jgi:hypothetical protein
MKEKRNGRDTPRPPANQGFFWWELDISYSLIKLLGWTGVVWEIRKPSRRNLQEAKTSGEQAAASNRRLRPDPFHS